MFGVTYEVGETGIAILITLATTAQSEKKPGWIL